MSLCVDKADQQVWHSDMAGVWHGMSAKLSANFERHVTNLLRMDQESFYLGLILKH